jgi:predicted PurR-regulated permease PerM
MKNPDLSIRNEVFEILLQLVCILLIVGFCLMLLLPFMMPVLWAIILAIIFYPLYNFLQRKLNGRKKLAATIITIVVLALMVIPVVYFLEIVTANILDLKAGFDSGTLTIEKPAHAIKGWPIIGEPLYDFLHSLSTNLQQSLIKYSAQITELSRKLVSIIISSGVSFLQFVLSVIIAGILLVSASARNMAIKFVRRIAGNRSDEILAISVSTVYQVVKGVIGVALIQSIIQAFGLFLAGVPFAGILTLLCLILAILQIGPIFINIGVIIYLFSTGHDYAILWTIFFILSGLSDNFLKPMLLGKGAMVPMLVIFLGVIGGFILSGFIGLFIGPIIFSIGYKLFVSWLNGTPETTEPEEVITAENYTV